MLRALDHQKLVGVVPPLAKAVRAVAADAERYGADVAVINGRRSQDEQRRLYAIGRRGIPGERPVTWTLQSKHLTGEAVDLAFYVNGVRTYTVPAWWWDALAVIGGWHGLRRPALSKGDLGHYEL